jgi:hypothetical protein
MTMLLLLLALFAGDARAQEAPELELRLIRTFGYGGINEIEGNFNLALSDPPPLERAEFLFDGQVVHTATSEPFEYRFHTGEYSPEVHTMSALGYTPAGDVLASNSITMRFLSDQEARQAVTGIIVPMLTLILGIMAGGFLLSAFVARRRGFVPGQYGSAGGAICPRCGMPYSRHVFSLNLITGKLERCPHCGKWAIVGRASPLALQQAENLLREGSLESRASSEDEEARLRRMLEESKFDEE